MLYPPVDAGPAAPFRLTRRGLVVVSALVGALCAALVWVAAWSAATARAADRPRPIASSPTTVRPGDTLWSIAARVAPSVDPRAEVALLQRVNHLSSAALVPGQRIRLG
jgi:Tfp pilus assembly protein FimV